MATAYCEIIETERRTSVNFYTVEQYNAEIKRRKRAELRRKREAHRARQWNRVRETIGGFVGMAGFVVTVSSGGCSEIGDIIIVGVVGLAMMASGAWLAHAFYGQEKDAEWLRRLRGNAGARK